jgi:hypothetical protein
MLKFGAPAHVTATSCAPEENGDRKVISFYENIYKIRRFSE